jgi:hypothetical protein
MGRLHYGMVMAEFTPMMDVMGCYKGKTMGKTPMMLMDGYMVMLCS